MPPIRFNYRLGKQPKRVDRRTLQFRKYAAKLAPPPTSVSYQSAVPAYAWNVDGNDTYGDCTVAAWAHLVESMSYNATPAAPINVPPAQVVQDYFALTGGPDTGLDLLTVLKAWTKGLTTGLPTHSTDSLTAYAELSLSDPTELRQGIYLFGGDYIGLQLPDYVLSQELGDPWALPSTGPAPAPDPSNGHCVPLLGYDATWFYCLTWGAITPVSPAFLAAYMDEAYVPLSADFLDTAGLTPAGFDLAQLEADVAEIQGAPSPSSCTSLLEDGIAGILAGAEATGFSQLERGIVCLVESLAVDHAAVARKLLEAKAAREGDKLHVDLVAALDHLRDAKV